MKKILILLVSLVFVSNAQNSTDKEILKAMKDEIVRSMDLQLEDLKKPYYIEYKIKVRDVFTATSSLGNIVDTNSYQNVTLNVELRIGDYTFDNTNFFDVGLGFFGSSDDEERFVNRPLPTELNYEIVRRNLWLATDAAYKQALEIFTKKEATVSNKNRKDTTVDFMQVKPEKNYLIEDYKPIDKNTVVNTLKKTSEVFRNYKDIMISSVGIEYVPEKIYYLNSEGMEYITSERYAGMELIAFTIADDGMPLGDFYSIYNESFEKMPSQDSLINLATELADVVSKLKSAEVLEDAYSGPVLFSPQASAELFSQVFSPNFVTQRTMLTEGGVTSNDRFTAFQMKVGGRVLPDYVSVKDNPNSKDYNGEFLFGYYKLDDNGIKPKNVELVEDGYLQTLLSERIPTKRIRENTGHKRGGGAMFSNQIIEVSPDRSVSKDSLTKKLIDLAKARELPYALLVDRVMNQNIMYTTMFRNTTGAYRIPRGDGKYAITRLYKIYPDGKKVLVRGGDGAGLTYQSFRDVLLAGKENYVYNFLAPSVISPFITGGSQYVGASIISPSLLFEDSEVRTIDEDFNKPPFLENPISLTK